VNCKRKERVIVYIDGFNLYYGMKRSHWQRYYWLDIGRFARALARRHQEVVGVKYFTSRINGPPAKVKRQATYLEALEATGGIEIHYGHYRSKIVYCERCCKSSFHNGEKKTDVNIATHLLIDAMDDRFDTAMVVSGDGDLLLPIQRVPSRFPGKKVWMAFPPNRSNRETEAAAGGKVRVKERMLAENKLPPQVVSPSGVALVRPPEWS
jgi:uncharacterized LabA/DUF88 family protein